MKQLFQDLQTGKVALREVPCPQLQPGCVMLRTRVTLISIGTERMLASFGKAGWIEKALQRPDDLKRVLQKLRTDGLQPTLEAVFSRLEEPLPLGYCCVGDVVAVGEGVERYKIGDRVAANGPHAEFSCLPENLCVRIPDEVADNEAAFTVAAAVALQGVRLLQPEIGETTVVLGLGLLGLLACQILTANGCSVIGLDIAQPKVDFACSLGLPAERIAGESDSASLVSRLSNGTGFDGVLVTAATADDMPMIVAPQLCRKRGRIVLVGVSGLKLRRSDFYKKELTFKVSCSYGPGRYDRNYEEKGVDYPLEYVRWTEQRNFETVMQLLQRKALKTDPLITNVVPFHDAERRYDTILQDSSNVGVLLSYESMPSTASKQQVVWHRAESQILNTSIGMPVLGVIGAGRFCRSTLLPILSRERAVLRAIVDRTGSSGSRPATKYGFEYHATDYQHVLRDKAINTIVIATPHNTHAKLVLEALNAGKNVFVEKPLAINSTELFEVARAAKNAAHLCLMVGFNRRYSPFANKMKSLVSDRSDPLCLSMTINAGELSTNGWLSDDEQGGRIIGEVCHFVDLACFLTGSRVQFVHAGGLSKQGSSDESVTATLGFENGSIAAINYFTNGHRDFPKERIEVFSAGRVLILDNFRSLRGYGFSNFSSSRSWHQDKGHAKEIGNFLSSIREGKAAVSVDDLVHSSYVTLLIVESMKLRQRIEVHAIDQNAN